MSGENETIKLQTLHCDKCKDWLKLEFKKFDKKIEGIQIFMPDMPVLVCPSCGEEYETDWAKRIFIPWVIDEAKKKGKPKFQGEMKKASQRRYDICKDLNFKYDANDCKCIPGLFGLAKEGFFTPVFFDRKVLHKYLSFDEYRVDIAGNTYGTIFFPDGHDLSYGINRNGKMFCWLGDIEDEVSKNERLYLLSENIESDHDVASEFYAATREAEFADYSNENKLLNARSAFDQFWNDKYSSKIFRYEKNIYDILEDLIRPVNWNTKGVIHVFNSINKVCIESMCKDSVIDAIKKKEPDFDAKSTRAMKLLEKLIEITSPTSDAKEIMKPFFVLYDFRLVLDHDYTKEEEKENLDFCYDRLGIPKDYKNFEKIYDKLMEDLTESYAKIVNELMS